MDQQQVVEARDAGDIVEAVITPDTDANGWVLMFILRSGEQSPYRGQSGTKHLYHDLDQASRVAKELGFEDIRVEERF